MALRDRLSADARREATQRIEGARERLQAERELRMDDGGELTPAIFETRTQPAPASIRAAHQDKILADFQEAEQVNERAQRCLADAERMAAQSSLALVEARKRMRRVAEGVI